MREWILTSTAMILIVIALRGILKGKISAKLRYGLWALVLVRLLLPFSVVDSAISVSNLLSAPVIREAEGAVADYQESYDTISKDYAQRGQEVTTDDIRLQVQQQLYDRAYSQIENEYRQSGAAVTTELIHTEAQRQVEVISLTAVITEALPWIWIAGMVTVTLALTASNLQFRRNLRRARATLECPDVPLRVYLSDYVATPCLFGVARPEIYLTQEVSADPRMRSHVIAHELTHYRHGDHIWSVLRSVCLVLHWYNPLVWAAAVLSKQDAELACDEATIKALGEQERGAYGRTLVGMTCVRRDPQSLMLTATTMLGSKKTLKERITHIAKKPKTAFYTMVSCILVAAIAVGCTFTGAPEAHKMEEEILLDRCREAVEFIQNLKHFEITEHTELNEASEDVLGPFYDEGWYVYSGDNWYISRTSADRKWEFVQISGEKFQKLTTKAIPEEDNQYSEWTTMPESGHIYADPVWIMDLKWTEDAIEYQPYTGNRDGYICYTFTPLSVSSNIVGSQEFIRVELQQTNKITDEVTAWVLTFRFDAYSGEVTEVKREIHAADALEVGGIVDAKLYSTNTLGIFYTGTEKDMLEIIESLYRAESVPVDPTEPTTEPPTAPATEPTVPGDVSEDLEDEKVTQEQLLARAKFQELLTRENGYWYWRAMGCTFFSAEEINLEYLFYNGLPDDEGVVQDPTGLNPYTDSEVAFLKAYAQEKYGDESVWTNAHKYTREGLNEVLVTYFGITIDDVTIPERWRYFEETDSYYVIRFDAYGVNDYTIADVQTDENGLIYVYWTVDYIRDTRPEEIKFINEPQMVMVLEEREDGGYRIHLNLPVEELLDTSDEEYFQNLLTSQNGYWYWRAMGCVFENAEDIDMTLLCYRGMEERILYSTFTDDEIEFLKSRYPANDFDDSPWSNAHKLPRQELEDVMQTYFGVSLDDVSIPWVYYEETDAYYHVKYDSYGLVGYTVTDVDYHDDGTVSVYWYVPFGLWDTRDPENEHFLDETDMLLTLKDNGDGTYTVLSNLPV